MKRYTMWMLACAALAGCSFYARGPDDYRRVVRKKLEEKQSDVETCYKQSYEQDKSAQGRVVSSFKVEAKTGKLIEQKIVPEGTTANDALQKCVLASLDGVAIDPPDQRTGDATFTWDFAR